MVQSTRAAAGVRRCVSKLFNRVAAAYQDMSFPKKAKSGSLKQKEKAERERKQKEGRQLLTIFFQKKGEHSSQLTQFKARVCNVRKHILLYWMK